MTQHVAVDVGSLVANRAVTTPDRPAVTFDGRTSTFGELGERVARLARHLRDGGVGPGDRVAYIGANHPSFLETFFAAARLGAVFVPLNWRLTSAELAYILSEAEVHTIVADAERRPTIDSIRDDCGVVRGLTVGPTTTPDRWTGYEAALARAEPSSAPAAPPEDSVAVIMYTSGTTGRPRGAMLTHGNLWWHHVNTMHAFDVSADDVTLVVAPLFHIGGLNITTLSTLVKGGHAVIAPGFDAAQALHLIERHRVTTMFGVPAMFNFMMQHSIFPETDLTSLQYLVCGGAPVPEVLMRTYDARGIPFIQAYGLTETAPLALVLAPADVARKLGSAGHRLMLLSEVRTVDRDNNAVGARVPGEVCIRGPQVMAGYWRSPAATAEAIDADGWFHSGDIGYIDEEGFVFIVDRSKDMVISGGENVYPAEVEAVLYEHPSVAEVAVIGTTHPKWGEGVTAVVNLKPGQHLTLDELRGFARDRLAGFKLPIRLEIVPELPRTPSGKVLKYQLRQTFS